MKTTKGSYEGASRFVKFDKSVSEMTEDEMRHLLENILFLAMPGEDNAAVVYHALEVAEENAKTTLRQLGFRDPLLPESGYALQAND